MGVKGESDTFFGDPKYKALKADHIFFSYSCLFFFGIWGYLLTCLLFFQDLQMVDQIYIRSLKVWFYLFLFWIYSENGRFVIAIIN